MNSCIGLDRCLLAYSKAVPIVPRHEVGASISFWGISRRRLAAAGALLEADLRCSELAKAQERWQHLVPEPEHERLIRELKASPERPQIQACFEARKGL